MPLDTIDADAFVGRIFARAIAPDPDRMVSDWADANRVLGPEESPHPGPWSTARVPFMREPMDCCSLSHPARRVTVMASAQVAKTNVVLNFLGQIAAETPTTVLAVLPSIDESRNWNKDKLQPMIDNSPAVRDRVVDIKSRDEKGSTSTRKHFPGGLIELTGANSSKGLQSRTRQVVVFDEISEFPFDADGRGDPVTMAEKRTTAWTGREKIVAVSTPGIKGSCRITGRFDDSSRGRFHVPCPHCQHMQPLTFDRLRWTNGQPDTAMYHCIACGAGIRHADKATMLAAGEWVHERPELLAVHAGFALNALYSTFVNWEYCASDYEKSRNDPVLLKVHTQQVRGEAYEERHDTVPHQALWERRTAYPAGRIPAGCLFITCATDVHADRLEWGAYAFDRDMGQWWIDGGVLSGDPLQDDVWLLHDQLIHRRWRDAWGQAWSAESWGIDAGYHSQRVYAYARRHAHRGSPSVLALDGRARWGEPAIGTSKAADVDYNGKKIGTVQLWPVGTWDIKTEIMSALRLTEMGPDTDGKWPRGAMRFPDRLDIGFFEQLTAEACVVRANRSGYEVREWVKLRARNEQLDIAVYCRALARHEITGFDESDWSRLADRRLGKPDDLLTLMQSDLAADARAPLPPPAVPPAPAFSVPAEPAWIELRTDWFPREDE